MSIMSDLDTVAGTESKNALEYMVFNNPTVHIQHRNPASVEFPL